MAGYDSFFQKNKKGYDSALLDTPVPFDATKTGVLVNTIKGLPQASRDVTNTFGTNLVQGFLKEGAIIGNKVLKGDINASFTPQGRVGKALYGTNEPISLTSVGKEASFRDASSPTIPVLDPLIGGVITSIDLLSAGESKVGRESLFKSIELIAKTADESIISSKLRSITKLPKEAIPTLTKELVNTHTPEEVVKRISDTVKKYFREAEVVGGKLPGEVSPVSTTLKAVPPQDISVINKSVTPEQGAIRARAVAIADDLHRGAITEPQANEQIQTLKTQYESLPTKLSPVDTSISKDLQSLTLEAQKYKSAEEFVKGKNVNVILDNNKILDVKATENALPKAPEGFERFYRAESPTVKHGDAWGERGDMLPTDFKKGDSFHLTPDLKYAQYYKDTYGKDAKISYFDLPKGLAKASDKFDGEFTVTKSQLTDFYNKATSKTGALSAQQAISKGMSKEEWIKGQGEKGYRSAHQVDRQTASPITEIREDTLTTFTDEFRRQYGYPSLKSKEVNKLKSIISNPDADITIYRASPKNELNSGDWVTIDKDYANDIKRQNGGKVYEHTVKAKDLFYPNTVEGFKELPSLNKWGAFQYESSITRSQLTAQYDEASKPVEAFKTYKPFTSGPKVANKEVEVYVRNLAKEEGFTGNLDIIFDKELVKREGLLGKAEDVYNVLTGEVRKVITIATSNGKSPIRVAGHELKHVLGFGMDDASYLALRDSAAIRMNKRDFDYYKGKGYKTRGEQIDEFIADEWGKKKADEAGYKSRIQKILDIIDAQIKKIVQFIQNVIDRVKTTPNKQGGFAKNALSEFDRQAAHTYHDNRLSVRATEMKNELEQLSIQLEIKREAVSNNPARSLASRVAKRGNDVGTLSERNMANLDNGLIQEAGYEDFDSAKEGYEQYVKDKKALDLLEKEVRQKKTTLSLMEKAQSQSPTTSKDYIAEPRTNAVAKSEKSSSVKVDQLSKKTETSRQSQQSIPQLPQASRDRIDSMLEKGNISEGEARSLEKLARQAGAVDNVPDYLTGSSYVDNVPPPQTPVNRKVNFVDRWLRTPTPVLEKIGFGKEAHMLTDARDEYWKELPKQLEKIGAWEKRVPSKSNERIFNYLDGEAVDLTPLEKQVATEIQAFYREFADRLGLLKEERVTNYVTRLFDADLIKKEFPEELAKLIDGKIAGSVFDPFLLKRLGAKGYKKDTWAALDAYVKRAVRKIHVDPVLEKIQSKAGASLDVSFLEKTQFKYIQEYIDNVNMRPSDLDESLDNFIKSIPQIGYKFGQRPFTALTKILRRLTFRGALGLNLGSALRNLSQGVNTYAVLGEKYTVLGYVKLLQKGAIDELAREGVLNSGFIQDKSIHGVQKFMEKADKGLFFFFDMAEKINRGSAYFGAKSKFMDAWSKGKVILRGQNKAVSRGENVGVDLYTQAQVEDMAVKYAKSIVRKTQFSFDPADTPVALQGELIKTFFQFQTYTVKQMEFLVEMAKKDPNGNRNLAGYVRYIVVGLLFTYNIGKAFGMKPEDLIPSYRIGTPPAAKGLWEIFKGIVDVPDKFGNDRNLQQKVKDISKSLVNLIPAGSQIKKTLEGAEANRKKGAYTSDNKLQYKTGKTTGSKVQNLLFGKYSGKEAKAYFNKKSQPNNKKRTNYDNLFR